MGESAESGGELRVREECSIGTFNASIHVTTKTHLNS